MREASRRTCSFGLLSKVGSSFRIAGFGAFERFEQVDARENDRIPEILSGSSIREAVFWFRQRFFEEGGRENEMSSDGVTWLFRWF